MNKAKPSVFISIQRLQAFVSTIAFNQPHAPTTCWNSDYTILQYKNLQVKISNLVDGVSQMFKDLLKKMHSFSGGEPIPVNIPKDHIDDLNSIVRGESWLNESFAEDGVNSLMYAMIKKGLWRMSAKNSSGGINWNRIACEKFLAEASEIVDYIITLVHLGAGPPLRGEDITREQIANGHQPRTIYLVFGQILAIRRHSKDTNSRGIDAFNPCYFPKKLSDAICYYLLIIRPLEKLIAWKLYGKADMCLEYDLYLYVKHGKRMTSPDFSSTLKVLTAKYIGVSLSIQPLRHIMIAFQRAFVEPVIVEKGNNIGDLLSSHNSTTGIVHYAIEFNIEGVTSAFLLKLHKWCTFYHDAIGLGDRAGPLVSLDTKEKLAHKIASLGSLNPNDPFVLKTVSEVLKSLGENAYRSGLQELKSQMVPEIWEAITNYFEKADLNGMLEKHISSIINPHRLSLSVHHQSQGPSIPNPLAQAPIPSHQGTLGFNTETQPSPFYISQSHAPDNNPLNTRFKRRRVSDQHKPATKKRHCITREELEAEGSGCANPESEDISHALQDIPVSLEFSESSTSAGSSTSVHPIKSLPARSQSGDIQEETTLQELSTMTLDTNSNLSAFQFPTAKLPVSRSFTTTSNPPPFQPTVAAFQVSAPTLQFPNKPRTSEPFVLRPPAPHPSTSQLNVTSFQPSTFTLQSPDMKVQPLINSPRQDPTDVHLQALRRYRRDPLANFKTLQQKKLLEFVQSQKHSLAVLPTGSGKSLAFELPPTYTSKITLVAIPYTVIVNQVIKNAKNHQVPVELWEQKSLRELKDSVRMIVVTYNTLFTDEFLE